MTTIAYRDGTMAADSLVTGNDIRRGRTPKIARLADGGLLGICGAAGMMPLLQPWIDAGARWDARPTMPGEVFALLVRPSGAVFAISSDMVLQPVHAPFHAQGSGNEIALGAMAMGATAAEAVAVAARFDVYTGGPIVTLSLADPSPPPSRSPA